MNATANTQEINYQAKVDSEIKRINVLFSPIKNPKYRADAFLDLYQWLIKHKQDGLADSIRGEVAHALARNELYKAPGELSVYDTLQGDDPKVRGPLFDKLREAIPPILRMEIPDSFKTPKERAFAYLDLYSTLVAEEAEAAAQAAAEKTAKAGQEEAGTAEAVSEAVVTKVAVMKPSVAASIVGRVAMAIALAEAEKKPGEHSAYDMLKLHHSEGEEPAFDVLRDKVENALKKVTAAHSQQDKIEKGEQKFAADLKKISDKYCAYRESPSQQKATALIALMMKTPGISGASAQFVKDSKLAEEDPTFYAAYIKADNKRAKKLPAPNRVIEPKAPTQRTDLQLAYEASIKTREAELEKTGLAVQKELEKKAAAGESLFAEKPVTNRVIPLTEEQLQEQAIAKEKWIEGDASISTAELYTVYESIPADQEVSPQLRDALIDAVAKDVASGTQDVFLKLRANPKAAALVETIQNKAARSFKTLGVVGTQENAHADTSSAPKSWADSYAESAAKEAAEKAKKAEEEKDEETRPERNALNETGILNLEDLSERVAKLFAYHSDNVAQGKPNLFARGVLVKTAAQEQFDKISNNTPNETLVDRLIVEQETFQKKGSEFTFATLLKDIQQQVKERQANITRAANTIDADTAQLNGPTKEEVPTVKAVG